MIKFIPLFLSIVLLSSCTQENQIVTVKNQYSLSLPGYMSKMSDLHDEASLQYGNLFKEAYVIVLDEPKNELRLAIEENQLMDYYSNDLTGYADLIFSSMEMEVSNGTLSEIVDTVIQGVPAKMTTLIGDFEGTGIEYYLGVYEGEENYYQIISWTLLDKSVNDKKKLESILYTFKELP